ncbi:hypothetical protein SAMN05444161_7734 [Rhizobiales bacterium GAS191]|nr:hypothetical protein SAMN05519103_07023 [Rhizobiales bacterium GAS113]SED53634.1 hypothetical protein SAMN05519104_3758 [Rhizobiales bacterium GAS188]SEE90090.1 hypothetical protein SAMN05444161_7734 [Rhizobiales bacterium GAS191]
MRDAGEALNRPSSTSQELGTFSRPKSGRRKTAYAASCLST